MQKKESKWLTIAWIPVLMLLAVSAAVALPILWRGFYYLHIDALDLPAATGWDKAVIRAAYDEMMNFCVKNAPFGTGALEWSEEGMRHFDDVRRLFRLDLVVLVICLAALAVLVVTGRRFKPARLTGRKASFFAGCGLLVLAGILTVLAALDFDRAFVVFHKLFFPGKTNWIFDPAEDQIILILPQVFFRNCAILAVTVLALFCAGYILYGRRKPSA